MPVKRRLLKEWRGYGHGHLAHYFFGHDFFKNGFGIDVTSAVEAEMRAAWPILREQVFQLARERSKLRGFIRLPAFWWICDSPEARDKNISEDVQLKRLRLDASVILFG